MKATGIVRRIDELGRVVIPKEIRKSLGIREGDPLEMYTDAEKNLILKKYSPTDNSINEINRLTDLAKTLNIRLGVYNADGVLISGTDTLILKSVTILTTNYDKKTNLLTFTNTAHPCYPIKDTDGEITAYVIMYSPEENAVSKGQVFALAKMLEKTINNT